ncbi:hypothetical protein OC834_000586 [Tilletia horrida]|nr:hypothetical protein OC834_000586 [Tilletia horrida]
MDPLPLEDMHMPRAMPWDDIELPTLRPSYNLRAHGDEGYEDEAAGESSSSSSSGHGHTSVHYDAHTQHQQHQQQRHHHQPSYTPAMHLTALMPRLQHSRDCPPMHPPSSVIPPLGRNSSSAGLDELLGLLPPSSSAANGTTPSVTVQARAPRPGAAQRARNRNARVMLLDRSGSPVSSGPAGSAGIPSSVGTSSGRTMLNGSNGGPAGTVMDAGAGLLSSVNDRSAARLGTSAAAAAATTATSSSIPMIRRREPSSSASNSRASDVAWDSWDNHLPMASPFFQVGGRLTSSTSTSSARLPVTTAGNAADEADNDEGVALMRRAMRRRRLDMERRIERQRQRESVERASSNALREQARDTEGEREETRPLLIDDDYDSDRAAASSRSARRTRPRWGLSNEQYSSVEALISDWQLIEYNAPSAENGTAHEPAQTSDSGPEPGTGGFLDPLSVPIIRRSPSPIDPGTAAQDIPSSNRPGMHPSSRDAGAPLTAPDVEEGTDNTEFQIPPWRLPPLPAAPPPVASALAAAAEIVLSPSSSPPLNFAQTRPASTIPNNRRSATLNVNVNLNRTSPASSLSVPSSAISPASSSSGTTLTAVRDDFRARRSPRRMSSVTDEDVQAFGSHLAFLRASGSGDQLGLGDGTGSSQPGRRATLDVGAGRGAAHSRSEGNSPEARSPISTIRLPVNSSERVRRRLPDGSADPADVGSADDAYLPTSRWFPPSMRRPSAARPSVNERSIPEDEASIPPASAGPAETRPPAHVQVAGSRTRTAEEVEQGRELARQQASQAETWIGSAAERDFQRLLQEQENAMSSVAGARNPEEEDQGAAAQRLGATSTSLGGAAAHAPLFGPQAERLSDSERRLARLVQLLRAPQAPEGAAGAGAEANASTGTSAGTGDDAATASGRRDARNVAAAPLSALRERIGMEIQARAASREDEERAVSGASASADIPIFRISSDNSVVLQSEPGRLDRPTANVEEGEEDVVDLLHDDDKVQLGALGVELMQVIDSRATVLYRSSIRLALAARARYHVPAQPRLPSTSAEYPLCFEIWQANGSDIEHDFKLNSPRGILEDNWRTWRTGQMRSVSVVLRFLYAEPTSISLREDASTSSSSAPSRAPASAFGSAAVAAAGELASGSSNPDNVLEAYVRRQGDRRAALAALTASAPFRRAAGASDTAAGSNTRASGNAAGSAGANITSSSSVAGTAAMRESMATHANNLQRFLELLHEELAVLEETYQRNARNSGTSPGSGQTGSGSASPRASGSGTGSGSRFPLSSSSIPGPVSMSMYSARRAAATASTIARVQGLGASSTGTSLLPSQVRSLERLASTAGHGPERLAAVSSLGQTEIRALREIIASQVFDGSDNSAVPASNGPASDAADGAFRPPALGASGTVVLPKLALGDEEHELVQTCLDKLDSGIGMNDPVQSGLDLVFHAEGGPLKTLIQKRCDSFVAAAMAAADAGRGWRMPRGHIFHLTALEIRLARRNGLEFEGLVFVSEDQMPAEAVRAYEDCNRYELSRRLRSVLGRDRPGYKLLKAEEDKFPVNDAAHASGEASRSAEPGSLMSKHPPAAYFRTNSGYIHLDFFNGAMHTSSVHAGGPVAGPTDGTPRLRRDGRTASIGQCCVSGRFLTVVLLGAANAAAAGTSRTGDDTSGGEPIDINLVRGWGLTGPLSSPSGALR